MKQYTSQCVIVPRTKTNYKKTILQQKKITIVRTFEVRIYIHIYARHYIIKKPEMPFSAVSLFLKMLNFKYANFARCFAHTLKHTSLSEYLYCTNLIVTFNSLNTKLEQLHIL